MKQIVIDLLHKTSIRIYPLADIHLGDQCCDHKLLTEIIGKIMSDEDAYVILGGDLMNSAIKQSIQDTYHETIDPLTQLRECVRIFKPLADAGKILQICPGNHEERVSKEVGIDTTALMADQLGLTDRYSPTSVLLFVRLGVPDAQKYGKNAFVYTVYLNHGNGGGKRPGSKINALEDYMKTCDSDIYVVGHTHLPCVYKTQFFRQTSHCNCLLTEKLFVNTASLLTFGGYGDRKGFQPASNSVPVITITQPTPAEIWAGKKAGKDVKHMWATV